MVRPRVPDPRDDERPLLDRDALPRDDLAAVERDFVPLDFDADFVPGDLPEAPPALALREVPERLDDARDLVPDERELVDERPLPLLRDEPAEDARDAPPEEPSSEPHLPDRTRCAASATASAMIEPSLVALDIMLLAACDAVSAASSPASRILRRAAGLALIAAAAAARPAASISLLIAALAILSIVSFEPDDPDEAPDDEPDLDELLLEELLRGDFAMFLSLRCGKDTLGP